MEIRDAGYYISNKKNKNTGSQMGHTKKKIFQKNITLPNLTNPNFTTLKLTYPNLNLPLFLQILSFLK